MNRHDNEDAVSEVVAANAEFCEDLASYAAALGDLAALDPATATKDDYDNAAETVKSSRSDLSESADDLAQAEFDNLEAQAQDLDGILTEAPDDAIVADIVTTAQVQVAEVRASAGLLNTAVCTASTTTTTQP